MVADEPETHWDVDVRPAGGREQRGVVQDANAAPLTVEREALDVMVVAALRAPAGLVLDRWTGRELTLILAGAEIVCVRGQQQRRVREWAAERHEVGDEPGNADLPLLEPERALCVLELRDLSFRGRERERV